MEMVRLKNGSEEAAPLVAVTMMSLTRLFDEQPLAAYDLVMVCRTLGTPKPYIPFGRNGDVLKGLGMVTESGGRWDVHDSIRNIVLSAVTGDGLIGSPVQAVAP